MTESPECDHFSLSLSYIVNSTAIISVLLIIPKLFTLQGNWVKLFYLSLMHLVLPPCIPTAFLLLNLKKAINKVLKKGQILLPAATRVF